MSRAGPGEGTAAGKYRPGSAPGRVFGSGLTVGFHSEGIPSAGTSGGEGGNEGFSENPGPVRPNGGFGDPPDLLRGVLSGRMSR
ncbi:hypothetical protein GCM10007079_45810 [Nocardiopsis terrae]|nr:hypothetical protein GCM10007079_45810 [Nocardiopsis terrae]